MCYTRGTLLRATISSQLESLEARTLKLLQSFAYSISPRFLAHCTVNLLKIGIALILVSLYLSTFIRTRQQPELEGINSLAWNSSA